MTVTKQADKTLETVSRLLKAPVVIFDNISDGPNSEVSRAELNDGSLLAVKRYKGATMDGRDRMDVEFKTLCFLRQSGIHTVPEPVAFDGNSKIAIYRYVDGKRIGGSDVTPGDVDKLIEFIGALKNRRSSKGAERLCDAAEACFSMAQIVRNVESRRRILLDSLTTGAGRIAPLNFLNGPFTVAFGEISAWSEKRLRSSGGDPDVELAKSMRILSPSDFGFHNALRLDKGDMVFLDFEYFGWDDPAKLICDFLLSPAMSLDDDLRRRFAAGAIEAFREDLALPARVDAFYPLFGLKWVMIMLNDFLPGRESTDDKRTSQLARAETMLSEVMANYKKFKYAC